MAHYDEFPQTAPWRRAHDDKRLATQPSFGAPRRRYYPSTRQDLIDLVREAEETVGPAVEVRASGSRWALSECAITPHFAVEMRDPDGRHAGTPRLNRTLYEVLRPCMTGEAFGFFGHQGVTNFEDTAPLTDKFYLYHVEAGTKIWELYDRLDKGDESINDSIAQELNQYAGPWAMPTLGGAGGQTIVGAFSTGTHGGDVGLPPIADAVQAIHLIGTGGRQYWIEREVAPGVPLVDEQKISDLYGKIEVIRDENVLRSVIVSAGRLGIVYSVVLRVVRQYSLNEGRAETTWAVARKYLDPATWSNTANDVPFNYFLNNRHFVQVLVNPNGKRYDSQDHTCILSVRTAGPLAWAGTPTPLGRAERGGANAGNSGSLNSSDFLNYMCASASPVIAGVQYLINWFADIRNKALIAAALLSLISPSAAATALAVATTAQSFMEMLATIQSQLPTGPLGTTLAAFANWSAEIGHLELLRAVNDYVLRSELDPAATVNAISYAVMDGTNYRNIGCDPPGDSIEVFFDATSANLPEFVDRVLGHVSDAEEGRLTGTRLAYGGWISLRYMSKTAAHIGMQRWPITCAVEIAAPGEFTGTETLMKLFEKDAIELGATLHWGQRNHAEMAAVERSYDDRPPTGDLYLWRQTLSRLTDNGRIPTFSTGFTRACGLEVVQPLIAAFSITPQLACADKPFRAQWTAADNPPGTIATLTVWLPNGNATPTTLPLSGFTMTTMPYGPAVVELDASYTYQGRTLTDRRTVNVHGFRTGDVWTFDSTATCQMIDGSWRWAVSVPVPETEGLRITDVICRPKIGFTWFGRFVGRPDLRFGWTIKGNWSLGTKLVREDRHSLPDQPPLQSGWIFFLDTVTGCSGPAPQVHVEFVLRCGS